MLKELMWRRILKTFWFRCELNKAKKEENNWESKGSETASILYVSHLYLLS
jgi:hypothetical protein